MSDRLPRLATDTAIREFLVNKISSRQLESVVLDNCWNHEGSLEMESLLYLSEHHLGDRSDSELRQALQLSIKEESQ